MVRVHFKHRRDLWAPACQASAANEWSHCTRQGRAYARAGHFRLLICCLLVCRGAHAHAPAEPEPDLDASLIDLVAEVEQLQAGAEALSRGTPSPNPGSKPSMGCRPHSPRVCSPRRGRKICRQWAHDGGSQLVRPCLLASCSWIVSEHKLVLACRTGAALR